MTWTTLVFVLAILLAAFIAGYIAQDYFMYWITRR